MTCQSTTSQPIVMQQWRKRRRRKRLRLPETAETQAQPCHGNPATRVGRGCMGVLLVVFELGAALAQFWEFKIFQPS